MLNHYTLLPPGSLARMDFDGYLRPPWSPTGGLRVSAKDTFIERGELVTVVATVSRRKSTNVSECWWDMLVLGSQGRLGWFIRNGLIPVMVPPTVQTHPHGWYDPDSTVKREGGTLSDPEEKR